MEFAEQFSGNSDKVERRVGVNLGVKEILEVIRVEDESILLGFGLFGVDFKSKATSIIGVSSAAGSPFLGACENPPVRSAVIWGGHGRGADWEGEWRARGGLDR